MTVVPRGPGVSDGGAGRMVITARSPDHPDATAMAGELHADQVARYGFADPPVLDPGQFGPPGGAFAVLYVDGRPAGCGGWRWHDQAAGVAELKKLYVAPWCRGAGAGRALLGWLEEHAAAAGAGRAILETGARNIVALALFRSAGYEPRERYVPGRDPAINRAFARRLTGPGEPAPG